MKKALLFTIGLVIMASVLLALAALNFRNSELTKDRLAEIGSLDRISSAASSVSNGFKDLFNAYSNIDLTITNENLTFEEDLPNSISNFRNNLDSYKNYVESNDKSINLSINNLKTRLLLNLFPHNITYKHNFANNEIFIVPYQLPNFNKYYVELPSSFNITSCIWSYSNGSLNFELKTNNQACNGNVYLDSSQNNLITINNGLLIRINNTLLISNSLSTVRLKIFIGLNDIGDTKVLALSDQDIINIKYNNLNISKNSGFRII